MLPWTSWLLASDSAYVRDGVKQMTTYDIKYWQSKIDEDFPLGLTMTWEGEEEDFSPTFPIPCIVVDGVVDDLPSVQFFVFKSDRHFGFQIISYEEIQVDPVRVVRVEHTSLPAALWSGNVSPALGAAMAVEIPLIRQSLGSGT